MNKIYLIALASVAFLEAHSCFTLQSYRIHTHRVTMMSASSDNNNILRRVDKWACVKDCGACCKLGPIESRPQLNEYLNEIDYARYESLIGPDDWCKNFDQENRLCKVYDTRPDFCRVDSVNFKKMYDIDEEDLNVRYVHTALCQNLPT